MIGHVKPEQGKVFTVGADDAPVKILLVGSCRTLPYVNYLIRAITQFGAQIRLQAIDPHDWHWDESSVLVPDFYAALDAQEQNEGVLCAIREATVYLHEYYAHYGMFNSDRNNPKNIYQFGLTAATEICLPNFHDVLILFGDMISVDAAAREMYANGVTPELLARHEAVGKASLAKFYGVCAKTSFPEMAAEFAANWTKTRYFWTSNHISKYFSLYLWYRIAVRFIDLPLSPDYWYAISQEDLFSKPCTAVTEHDRALYGLTWTE